MSDDPTPRTRTKPRANYPHVRRAGDYIYVSGTSPRQPDNSIPGAAVDEMGTTNFDIGRQTEAALENIRHNLQDIGADLSDLCELSCFLVDMNDFGGFNRVYNRYFDAETGPARTTVAVHQLPHPHLRIEIKAIAYKPERNG